MSTISKRIFYPLWDVYDQSLKLNELGRLERNQWCSIQEKKTAQLQSLRSVVEYAKRHCAFYRRNGGPHIDSWEALARWPVLTKAEVRRYGADMISDAFGPDELVQAKTGGSTGVSLKVYFDETCEEKRNAAGPVSYTHLTLPKKKIG